MSIYFNSCYRHDAQFHLARKSFFGTRFCVVNVSEENFLFQLAKYCDSLLKKSTKHLTELEIDDKLNNVVSMLSN